MLYYNTPLRLVLCLTIGLSATACNGLNIDPEDWGIGGGDGSDDGDAASTTDSASSSSQGGGSATAGSGGAGGDATTGGAGGDATTAGSGGEGGSSTTTAGAGGAGGAGGGATTSGAGGAPPLDPACGPDTATFADVAPILERSCSNQYCHGNAGSPAGGLDLRTAAAASSTVNQDAGSCSREQALVVPFMPSKSYLMNKLKDVGLCNPDEFSMPPGSALPDSEIKTINDWICAGAPDR
ncbi:MULTISPECIES: hypothetical protein [Sorangium]|uniref:PE-PGRS family protein n=1 Tax=Sorangium cellulosum TaxID=56 RepID=A0A4P2QV48_SORCE|nr:MULTISPECIES: hypothetical protein [Sorangium]AUX34225.1 hypothetical protein SOCE836_063950 [Sorangium cellulosum]WCQ93542.1 hypothetical protein NQZ70_06293 [Sorangium sp. Soce836]